MKIGKTSFIELDTLIREGQHALANQKLSLLLEKTIPREFLFEAAAISRRLSRSEIGVRLLNPVVRPPATKHIVATIDERAEYAACLIRLGLLKEAHSVLDTVSPKDLPRSLLFRAFAHIAHWDFEKSQGCLEEFMDLSKAETYETLIAKVNLALGYVFLESFEKANHLLDELCKTTLENKNLLLYANALELAAQSAILGRNFSLAEDLIRTAQKALTSSDTIDAFFLKKDQVILELFKSGNSATGIRRLEQIKREAQQRKFWEQSRDCDYYLAIATRKPEIAFHLYFGTPYKAYRKKLLSKLKLSPADLPMEYFWRVGSGRKKASIHTVTGKNSLSPYFLNDGQAPQRILGVLAADFYRPRRMMELFEGTFPDEYFMPKYSSDKLHQSLKRLRLEIDKLQVPLIIEEKSGFYQLAATKDYSIDIICPGPEANKVKKEFLKRRQNSKLYGLLEKFKKVKGTLKFTAKEFAAFHNISGRSALRHLKSAFEEGWVSRQGRAKFVKYKIGNLPRSLLKPPR